ncbi:MAG: phosphoribosyltransferase domain-containing protein [Lachnospiraceae bacterium]|nr:phosphoribosyltransferase domain-containing protein [Lachnospiraceae bacterium]
MQEIKNGKKRSHWMWYIFRMGVKEMVYTEQNLVRIAKRENNPKRKYLVVNRLQGKHIPVKPSEAIALFRALADTLRSSYKGETLLVIGFAETATAIGAAVAAELGTDYIQTTRELVPDVEELYFSEEHSHATEQKLVKNDLDTAVKTIDRILFVEDEVTTGKTILNIIDILRKEYPKHIKFSVASILNGMDKAALANYERSGIELFWLVKTDHTPYTGIAESYAGDGIYVDCRSSIVTDHTAMERAVMDGKKALLAKDASACKCAEVQMTIDATKQLDLKMINVWKQMNARRTVKAAAYQQYCESLYEDMISQMDISSTQKILVLGTEEFMYPALYTASKLEALGKRVWFHATTRSPIAVSAEQDYALHTRYELVSLYDNRRKTYVYNLQKYDTIVIMTDAQGETTEGICSLIQALLCSGNDHIIFVFS